MVSELPWRQLLDRVWPQRPLLQSTFAPEGFPEGLRAPAPGLVGAALAAGDFAWDVVEVAPGGLPPQGLAVLGRLVLYVCFTAAMADLGRAGWAALVRPAPLALYMRWAWGASDVQEAEAMAAAVEFYFTVLAARREWALI